MDRSKRGRPSAPAEQHAEERSAAGCCACRRSYPFGRRTPRQNDGRRPPGRSAERHIGCENATTCDAPQMDVDLAHGSLPNLSWRTGANRARSRVACHPRDGCRPSDLVRIRLPHEYGRARGIEVHPGDDGHGCIDSERAADMDRNGATAMKRDVPAVPSSKTHHDLHLSIWAQGNRTLAGMTWPDTGAVGSEGNRRIRETRSARVDSFDRQWNSASVADDEDESRLGRRTRLDPFGTGRIQPKVRSEQSAFPKKPSRCDDRYGDDDPENRPSELPRGRNQEVNGIGERCRDSRPRLNRRHLWHIVT